MIPLTRPSIDDDDLTAVCEVLRSGHLVQGRHVAGFEAAVAEYVGTDHAIAVSSGTAALHLALMALAMKPGDRVVVTAYSWIATANVIELCGARPVFVDIDPKTFNLDPVQLEETLADLASADGPRHAVRAILPVDAFGLPADLERIVDIADRYEIPVIEDAACALGASQNDRRCGSWGLAGCFSFHPRKSITTGEGGMVTTGDNELADRIRELRNHGIATTATPATHRRPGFNYRMTDMQGALGTSQLRKLERIVDARSARAKRYDSLLAETAVRSPEVPPRMRHTYQSYVVGLPPAAAARRDDLIRQLRDEGVETTVGTWNMPSSDYFKARYGDEAGSFPVTDDVAARALTLPLYEEMTAAEQERVVDELLTALGGL